MKTVLALGCFDFLHPGHIWHLEWARRQGDYLTVGLTVDAAVNKGPGRPHYSWQQRAFLLRQLRCVDYIIHNTEAVETILTQRPSLYIKGSDYEGKLTPGELEACRAVGCTPLFSPTPKLSSTRLLEALK